MEAAGSLHLVLEQVVPCPEVSELDRRFLLHRQLAVELLLAEEGGVVVRPHGRHLLLHFGAQLLLDLRFLAPQLHHLGMVRVETVGQRRTLRSEVEQREVELLDARTIEQVSNRLALGPAQEFVAALHRDSQPLGPGEEARELGDALPDDLLLLVDGDGRVLGSEAAERRLRPLDLFTRLTELATEELLRCDVGGPACLLVGLHVGLRVRRGEESRERRARGREADLHQVRPAHVPDPEIAHVPVQQSRLRRRGRCSLALGRRRAALPAPRPEERQQATAHRQETLPPGPRSQECLVLGEPLPADHPFGQVAALERFHLRGEEARGAVHVAIRVVDAQHVLLETELDGRLARQLEAGRGGVEARGEERHQGCQADGQPEAGENEPAVLEEHPEVLAEVSRRSLAELGVHDLGPRGRELDASRCQQLG